jgi:hypothetical protein
MFFSKSAACIPPFLWITGFLRPSLHLDYTSLSVTFSSRLKRHTGGAVSSTSFNRISLSSRLTNINSARSSGSSPVQDN